MTYHQQPDPESTTTEGEDVTTTQPDPEDIAATDDTAQPVQHKLPDTEQQADQPDTADDDTGAVDPEPADVDEDAQPQGGLDDPKRDRDAEADPF